MLLSECQELMIAVRRGATFGGYFLTANRHGFCAWHEFYAMIMWSYYSIANNTIRQYLI